MIGDDASPQRTHRVSSHALPDVRDGLLLVHRRVLLAMSGAGLIPGGPSRKSVAIVRDVHKRFQPRARGSAYDALIAMVQDFTCRYPLIEGLGNFGSIEGDPAAAPAYTEARLSPIATQLLADTDHGEGSAEPDALGGAVPNLIINGSSAATPNPATNIPPHNLREVVNAAIFLIDHPDAAADELHALVPGPDFPTGAAIFGRAGIAEYQKTGRGRITVRARAVIESDEEPNKARIVVTNIPSGVVVAPLLENIADLVRNKLLDGITDLRNESRRDEMCLVIGCKRDTSPHRVLDQLYERTAMQTTIDVNMAALVPEPETGLLLPRVLTLKELLEHFIAHRDAVIARRIGADSTSAGHAALLDSRPMRMGLIKDDLKQIADAYGDERRTTIG
jgi:DNA gyrase subunit A